MNQWEPIDYTDALELFTGRFINLDVKRYATSRLETASDDVLFYLISLIFFNYFNLLKNKIIIIIIIIIIISNNNNNNKSRK